MVERVRSCADFFENLLLDMKNYQLYRKSLLSTKERSLTKKI